MTTYLGARRRWLWLWLPILACQLLPDKVMAADRPDIPLVEVADLVLRPTPLIGKRIGVVAVVLCLDQLHCVLADHSSAQQPIKVDTQRLRIEDRKRLVRACFYAPCSEILVGALARDTFSVTEAYDTMMPISPVKHPQPRVMARTTPPARSTRGALG